MESKHDPLLPFWNECKPTCITLWFSSSEPNSDCPHACFQPLANFWPSGTASLEICTIPPNISYTQTEPIWLLLFSADSAETSVFRPYTNFKIFLVFRSSGPNTAAWILSIRVPYRSRNIFPRGLFILSLSTCRSGRNLSYGPILLCNCLCSDSRNHRLRGSPRCIRLKLSSRKRCLQSPVRPEALFLSSWRRRRTHLRSGDWRARIRGRSRWIWGRIRNICWWCGCRSTCNCRDWTIFYHSI